ncbi:hypothetical protein ACFC14_08570 [Microbacterium sp. NPDC055988]|uniref:hypothetical protein n=1 Tax=Microbacterium sp. NPDC055988 TaxID=3345671 RepID=UPI0035D798AA
MQRKYAWTALVIAGIALVGCTPTPGVEAPEVAWKDGAPSGELEDSPWVQAVRASDLALNTAWVTRDYTAQQLQSTTESLVIDRVAASQVGRAGREDFATFPGPTPMIPLSVDEESDTQAIVRVCAATNWQISTEQPEIPADLVGEIKEYRVYSGGGNRRASGAAPTAEECDLTDASIGLFDPQPDPTETYSPDDVKVP